MAAQPERKSKKSPFSNECILSHVPHEDDLALPLHVLVFWSRRRDPCRLNGTFRRFDFCGGDKTGQVVGNKGQCFFTPIRPSPLLPSLDRQFMIQVRLYIGQHTLKRRGRQIRIHVFQFLTPVQHPIEAFNSTAVMVLVGRIQSRHGGRKSLRLVDEVVKTCDSSLQSRIHTSPFLKNILSTLYMRRPYRQGVFYRPCSV